MSGQSVLPREPLEVQAVAAPMAVHSCNEAPLSPSGFASEAAPLCRDLIDATPLPAHVLPGSVSRRDLIFAARLLELPGVALLSQADLVEAIRAALSMGDTPERIDRDIRRLVETLQLAGRPTAANGLLQTLRTPA